MVLAYFTVDVLFRLQQYGFDNHPRRGKAAQFDLLDNFLMCFTALHRLQKIFSIGKPIRISSKKNLGTLFLCKSQCSIKNRKFGVRKVQ